MNLPSWAWRLAAALAGVQLVLSVAFVVGVALIDEQTAGTRAVLDRVDLSTETGLASFYTTLLMIAAGALALGLWRRERVRGAHGWSLVALAATMVVAAADEALGPHETLDEALGPRGPLDEGVWVLACLPLLVAGAAAILGAARVLRPPLGALARWSLAPLAVAVALDMVTWRNDYGDLVEENLEMVGVGMIVVALAVGLHERR